MAWSVKNIPDQTGRLAIVTGANTGLGYETALELAGKGAAVIVATRTPSKGEDAVRRILQAFPNAKVSFEQLDLANLKTVADFASRIGAQHASLDLLINNAGVMTPPERHTTQDGFELQFGVNYLAHFALTARLLPLLKASIGARVVNLSSGAHHTGQINFDDLQWEKRYRPWLAYSQSKLAMLMFAFELERRSQAAGWGLMSNAAHPGYARTDPDRQRPRAGELRLAHKPGADPTMDEPIGRRGRSAAALRGYIPRCCWRRLLRPGRIFRNEGRSQTGPDRIPGQGRGGGRPALAGV